MHAALLANTPWLEEELVLFRHLVVGLIDEQVRVAQVVPESFPAAEVSAFGERLTWRESRLGPLQAWRVQRLGGALAELGVDVLHALDGQLWEAVVKLAGKMQVPAVLVCSSAADLERVEHATRWLDDARFTFAAGTEPLLHAIRERVGADPPSELIPPGVYVPEATRVGSGEDQPICAVISGDGRLDDDYQALFKAIRVVIDEHPLTQFFLAGLETEQHRLWRYARRSGLLANLSIIPRRLGNRELLLQADVFLHPQALGCVRIVTIEAMARGLPVLARQDPWLDYLVEDQTGWLVHETGREPWVVLLRRVIKDRAAGQELGRRAQAWVRARHQASTQVERTLGVYRRMTQESLRFPS